MKGATERLRDIQKSWNELELVCQLPGMSKKIRKYISSRNGDILYFSNFIKEVSQLID